MKQYFLKFISFFIVSFALISGALAQNCPRTDLDIPWDSTCFYGKHSERHVKPQFVKNIVVNGAGIAMVEIVKPIEFLAIDVEGVVKIAGIFQTGGADFPYTVPGLSRFLLKTENPDGSELSKCGYFDNVSFEIKIPAIYDECLAFGEGTALVCNDCKRYCTELECQQSILVGGEGILLDSSNKALKRFSQKTLDQVCDGKPPEKNLQLSGNLYYISCPEPAMSPFRELR